ncbi:TetR/AcrR family transcriptional regulator [Leucobacter coleopterorum]|uniref:TetR/AcrR family transcriptional regulator n=1 Tax=Leucobacter coleopterorum TaxID=2714933 RepID=UPI001FCC9333|nr:TetR/AcrR family transcriptional regulator [Leucobacter coleopterorum]
MNEPRLKQRDAERTKAELLAEATSVFAESGYSGTRVDEIARRSSSTKRMIYYYFGSKEQLYLAVLEQSYRGIREAEQALDVGDLEPVEALRRLAELTYDHHLSQSNFIRLIAIENIHRGRFIRQIDSLRELSKPALGILDNILARGRESGVFRADVDALDVHMLISSYCVFQVANQYTFGHLFDVNLQAPSAAITCAA